VNFVDLEVDAPSPEQESAAGQRRRRVLMALATLSPEQREAIQLAFFSDLTHGELAARLGQPLGTVKSRIRLGMIKLREQLELYA
jgi:RNA polymerase sigma-70 factor (ECF subfamily)